VQVLVAEDTKSLQKILAYMLGKKLGHAVEFADNGLQALNQLKSEFGRFDLLLTDLQMPVRRALYTAVTHPLTAPLLPSLCGCALSWCRLR